MNGWREVVGRASTHVLSIWLRGRAGILVEIWLFSDGYESIHQDHECSDDGSRTWVDQGCVLLLGVRDKRRSLSTPTNFYC